jgi:hypothetical protein
VLIGNLDSGEERKTNKPKVGIKPASSMPERLNPDHHHNGSAGIKYLSR